MIKIQPIVRTVMLQVTEECNLNCSYCYQGNKSNKTISLDVAKQRMEKYLHCSKDYDEVVIDLMGGEVFLKFDLIRELCEWAWKQKWPIPLLIHVTTNGTLVHGNIQEWIISNKHRFSVGLSLDGTEEMHNMNRSKSYSSIDLSFFLKNWPDRKIKMTISPQSLSTLSQGIIHLHNIGFKVHANFAHLVDWSNPEYIKICKQELQVLTDYYLNHPEITISDLIDMPLWRIGTKNQGPIKWCGTGTYMVAVDLDGNEYPCQIFMPNAMKNWSNLKSFDLKEPTNLLDKYCSDCDILPLCPTCYGANIIQSGNPAIRDKNMCKLTKITAIAASFLKGKQLLNGSLEINDLTELNNTINAIQKLQKIII